MNKFGFLSWILTTLLFFLQYIPLGIFFGSEGNLPIWFGLYFGIETNPWISSFIELPIDLFNINGTHIHVWGLNSGGAIEIWFNIHLISFIFLYVLSLFALIVSLLGCAKENEEGLTLMKINFFAILAIFIYSIIGIPIYSKEIIGIQLQFLDIFYYFSFGFYILLIDLIFAALAYGKHPIK